MISVTRRGGLTFNYVNAKEFETLYHDIFVNQVYRFDARSRAPRILDCGAHIGVSVLYFKQQYPGAQITAFEPNPATFRILQENVEQNDLQGVTLVNAAISNVAGALPFYRHRDPAGWHWGDSAAKMPWYNEQQWENVEVPGCALSTYVTTPLDFLKLDIEGLERAVLAGTKLDLVRQMVVEYHGVIGDDLNGFLQIVKQAGFHLALRQGSDLVRRSQVRSDNLYTLLVYGHRSRARLFWQLRADTRARIRLKLGL